MYEPKRSLKIGGPSVDMCTFKKDEGLLMFVM